MRQDLYILMFCGIILLNTAVFTLRTAEYRRLDETLMAEVLVSVVIPAYNCAKTIRAAIDSVLQQEVPLEVLVLNDRSKQPLEEAMRPYENDPRVRYIINEKNLGASGSRNKGVKLAKGEYIAFLDADDYWVEGKLKKQLRDLLDCA